MAFGLGNLPQRSPVCRFVKGLGPPVVGGLLLAITPTLKKLVELDFGQEAGEVSRRARTAGEEMMTMIPAAGGRECASWPPVLRILVDTAHLLGCVSPELARRQEVATANSCLSRHQPRGIVMRPSLLLIAMPLLFGACTANATCMECRCPRSQSDGTPQSLSDPFPVRSQAECLTRCQGVGLCFPLPCVPPPQSVGQVGRQLPDSSCPVAAPPPKSNCMFMGRIIC